MSFKLEDIKFKRGTSFKLENVKFETYAPKQEIKSHYDFHNEKYLSDDRTFWCFQNCGFLCIDDDVCQRNDVCSLEEPCKCDGKPTPWISSF